MKKKQGRSRRKTCTFQPQKEGGGHAGIYTSPPKDTDSIMWVTGEEKQIPVWRRIGLPTYKRQKKESTD